MKLLHCLLSLAGLCISASVSHAHNLRQISSKDGLSNSSVYCLYQDKARFLWIGTFDGLNKYDGREIHIYKPDINNQNSLSSNVIRNIVETEDNHLWISTKWGLNKLSQRTGAIEEYYNEFKEDSYMACDRNDNLYVLGKTGTLSHYNKRKNVFMDLPVNPAIRCVNVVGFFTGAGDTIYITHDGIMEKYTVDSTNPDVPKINRHTDYSHPVPIDYAFYNKNRLLFVDRKGDLYIINATRTVLIRNILPLIRENGPISSIIMDDVSILIGFKTNGLFRLNAQQDYRPERIEINCGVFSLWKDEKQDIIWIGTDGQGVYAWTREDYAFKSINLDQLPVEKEKPVRAIHTDAFGYLWLGTKDNGIIRIRDFENNDYSPKNVDHFTGKDGLSNEAIFALAPSARHPVLWIGSDGPDINYYSYSDNKIHSLKKRYAIRFSYIHSLFESHDSLLWAGSGNTLIKIHFRKQGNGYEAVQSKRYCFNLKNDQRFNQIYALYPENDSIIWIGIRGNGVVRFNAQTQQYRLFTFDEKGVAPMNDILCILQDKNKTFWFGTSYGLIRFAAPPNGNPNYEYKSYNENDGLPNNTIHGILENADGELWLSTNTGVVLFNPIRETFRSFNQKNGLKVIEFSDNAYYRDERNATCFFGGVDGLVRIKNEYSHRKKYIPDIRFTKLKIFNREYPLIDFEKTKKGEPYLCLNHRQNSFSVSFVATDFMNGGNGKYSYLLENFSDIWMNTPSNEAQFTNIAPGNYVLKIRYNDGKDDDGRIASIRIVVRPPWYQSLVAKIIYAFLILVCIYLTCIYFKHKLERRKKDIAKQLDIKYKEEMYEGKLRFFTNITHEFCTPLTLIYGPCERILNHENSDSFVRKYAQIIKSNTERLNSLIQEVIDFRRMETGNKICHIQSVDMTQVLSEITASFNELAEQNHINFLAQIEEGIAWNSDYSCITKIMNNLISNAFKYTPPGGSIRVTVQIENNTLLFKVYNTGKGIRKEDIPFIFNRYGVLDNIRENSIKGLSSRNGLGLAICLSMTELLQGKIEVESEIDRYAQFTVSLPVLQPDEDAEPATAISEEWKNRTVPIKEYFPLAEEDKIRRPNENRQQATVLVVDDNKELLWMIKDILSDEYTVTTATDGEAGLQSLKQSTPDVIITDIMMPNLDGISLTKQLKQNRHTMHIPLIILSAKNATDEKIEGIESGADAYIPKPFDANYLKAIIKQLIQNKKTLAEYYNTSASAYDFSQGQLIQKEDKDFLRAAVELIDRHIADPNFLPEDLAGQLQVSVRNLYRKFKELGQLSPKDFIKEQRIVCAAKLLLTTTLTIQEIMYKTGFSNRSHFYKEFAKRHNGLTPKEYREINKKRELLL
ncbi:MAG: response regulator [Dysgonamonadaceae bacterium]|jgi:signal transduction histidine kinase/ligand-binding sensor domain-containing protein/DNA-binding NarL/FixJ family response regulator|nr:response regulator [Dysgonamonadaceae bacterium]